MAWVLPSGCCAIKGFEALRRQEFACEVDAETALAEASETFPNQSGRPVANPTARWVFSVFYGHTYPDYSRNTGSAA